MTWKGGAVAALVAEDEPILRADFESRLKLLWSEVRVVASAGNGVEALQLFQRHRPRIAFLDIEMPGLTGVEVAQQIAGDSHIVFITAYDNHAVTAFEQGAIDYVLKPYDNARLATAFRRLQQRLDTAPPPMGDLMRELAKATKPKEYLRWIKASRGHEVDLIMAGEVSYFQAEAKYTTVYTVMREGLIRTPIKELAEELDPASFWQIHRSTIVNVEQIETVSRGLSGIKVKMRGRQERLPVSDAHRHLFKHM